MNFNYKHYISIVFTFLVYTLFFNWQVGLLLVIGVGFHELSHLYAARQLGFKTKGFFLMPFMGGVAFIQGPYKTYREQAIIVMAGPLGGGLLALLTMFVYLLTGVPFLKEAAMWMFLMNGFNLLPLSILDGGQLLKASTANMSKTVQLYILIVSGALGALLIMFLNFIVGLIAAFIAWQDISKELKNYNIWNNWLNSGDVRNLGECDVEYILPPKSLSSKDSVYLVLCWAGLLIIFGMSLLFLSK